jgi:hypothetical protein
MLIFKNNKFYVYIHIPKNGGKYIRQKLMMNKKNEIIKVYWSTENNIDLAHIPYIKRNDYIDNDIIYHYFTYSRNPYHRFISAYFYLCHMNEDEYKNSIEDFRFFIKNKLKKINFLNYNFNIIHFCPQYLFICDEEYNIPSCIHIMKLEEHENPTIYDLSLYYDNECLSIINDVYIKDFELLKYPMINNLQKKISQKFNLIMR